MADPKRPINFLVIGAGSRGNSYARAVSLTTDKSIARIAAVAEPVVEKRSLFGKKYIWQESDEPGPGEAFDGWKEWLEWEEGRRARQTSPLSTENGWVDVAGEDEIIIDGVFVCTLDDSHAEILHALAHLNLHTLCEKPLALSPDDCLSIKHAYTASPPSITPPANTQTLPRIFAIGHVLRYSPHNTLLRRLLLNERVIGTPISLEHTEPIGYWHFAHSYVRGNWRHETPAGIGTLLTKSCHDIDFILWLFTSAPDPTSSTPHTPHLPSRITSTGHLSHFLRRHKPRAAFQVTNCVSCPLRDDGCAFSATRIYRDRWLRREHDTGWPLKIVVPGIETIVTQSGWEAAEDELMDALVQDYSIHGDGPEDPRDGVSRRNRAWYGRCVYEMDNDVVDDQTVVMSWDEQPPPPSQSQSPSRSPSSSPSRSTSPFPSLSAGGPKTALFHLTYATSAQCARRGRIHGSGGEITYDSSRITVFSFADEKTRVYDVPPMSLEEEKSHGGGDVGIARGFVRACVEVGDAGAGERRVGSFTGEGDGKGWDEEVQRVRAIQARYLGCDLDEVVRSHLVVFAAEESRLHSGRVVEFPAWAEGREKEWEEQASGKEKEIEKDRERQGGRGWADW